MLTGTFFLLDGAPPHMMGRPPMPPPPHMMGRPPPPGYPFPPPPGMMPPPGNDYYCDGLYIGHVTNPEALHNRSTPSTTCSIWSRTSTTTTTIWLL